MTKYHFLREAWKQGSDFLGTDHAVMCGAMSWVSEFNLVAAVNKAGCFGVIACGSMTPELLREQIVLTKKHVINPNFGVNLILMHPEIDKLIDVCVEEGVSHVILAGGIPYKSMVERVKQNGIKVMAFAPMIVVAKKLIKIGIDALIVEGMEAGGHIGPLSTTVLVQEILPNVNEVPVFIAGGIGTGEMIASYLQLGASGCQVGTLFACTKESIAHNNFKLALIKASARDTVISLELDSAFPVIPVRTIKNQSTVEFLEFQQKVIDDYKSGLLSKEDAQLKIEKYWAGALKRAVIDGDVERGSLMAGQSVGFVKAELSVQEVVDGLLDSAEGYLRKIFNQKSAV